jgi:hypothetical protein
MARRRVLVKIGPDLVSFINWEVETMVAKPPPPAQTERRLALELLIQAGLHPPVQPRLPGF